MEVARACVARSPSRRRGRFGGGCGTPAIAAMVRPSATCKRIQQFFDLVETIAGITRTNTSVR